MNADVDVIATRPDRGKGMPLLCTEGASPLGVG